MPQNTNTSRWILIAGGLILAVAVMVCLIVFRNPPEQNDDPPKPTAEVASDQVVAAFYKALAALDVEENQLAATTLKTAVESAPDEPALWANWAVAQMRLREQDAAEKSLNQAIELAPEARELALLRAEVLEHSGQIEQAIEQLRELRKQWPENIAAAFSLVSLLAIVRNQEADIERLAVLSDILRQSPGNLRALCELARVSASLGKEEELRTALDALLARKDSWPELATRQLADADQASQQGDFRKAAIALTYFENVMKPEPEYQQSLVELGQTSAGSIGTPLRSFLRLKTPGIQVADADENLAFELQPIPKKAARPDLALAWEPSGDRSTALLLLAEGTIQAGESAALPFPGSTATAHSSSVCPVDLNFDFEQDLAVVGEQGLRLFLGQADGTLVAATLELPEAQQPWQSVWAMDVEADGDMDLLLSDRQSPLCWLRNNGDMTFTATIDFLPVAVHDLEFADWDGDGDLDLATVDAAGKLTVWDNQRGGIFQPLPEPLEESALAITTGDLNRDGQLELVALLTSGQVVSIAREARGQWSVQPIATWKPTFELNRLLPGSVFLATADLDNNGGVDLITSHDEETTVWLRMADGAWLALLDVPEITITAIADLDQDGLLDVIGQKGQEFHIANNRSQAGYHWQVLQPKANSAKGDKRINSFGIGGGITLRAGTLVQTQLIRHPRVHFGLGEHRRADVAGITWPNGIFQAEFDLNADQAIAAEQRLKGSCPWVFADDGTGFRFIKDFIWRSPLGLRINAQATAGVTQTEDWIKIPGNQLAERAGSYSLRITAELWETHFFDHVRLLAVDHPEDVEVFVDERFIPNQAPTPHVILATKPKPFSQLVDQQGNSLSEQLNEIDGQYADTFPLGEYQGVTQEHWVAFEFPADADLSQSVLIVGHGWIYPTDSSLNVAIGQRNDLQPHGLILERHTANGDWEVVDDNLGFPAGKNKCVVIEVPPNLRKGSQRFRLRTNMEIYWDALGWSLARPEVKPQITALPLEVADLRYRGYSKLQPLDRRRPDTPLYEIEATGQRWPDLEGYYTRFGDVRELLGQVDDRYVIMNAGDEMAFEFKSKGKPPAGFRRDFVLVGDGWVKDGDFNTAFSRWVRPLPSHNDPDYTGPIVPLEQDRMYLKHPDDWRVFHTRYLSPTMNRLRQSAPFFGEPPK